MGSSLYSSAPTAQLDFTSLHWQVLQINQFLILVPLILILKMKNASKLVTDTEVSSKKLFCKNGWQNFHRLSLTPTFIFKLPYKYIFRFIIQYIKSKLWHNFLKF